jgi:DNA-binding transcriptional ArsR family regulator
MPGIDRVTSEAPPEVDADPRVLDLDAGAEVFGALTSGTARALLANLYDSPAPPSELASGLGTSVQNLGYHLDRLESAGLVEAVGSRYSEKGAEMDVYAPAGAPLVIRVDPGAEGPT